MTGNVSHDSRLKELERKVAGHDEALNGVPTDRSNGLGIRMASVEDSIADAGLASLRDRVLIMENNAIEDGRTRIEVISGDVAAIKSRINQVVSLVITAIIMGLLGLLFKG